MEKMARYKKKCKCCGELRAAGRFETTISTICTHCQPIEHQSPEGMKYCRVCKKDKLSDEFYKSHRTRCKECYRASQQEYYDDLPDEVYAAHIARCGENSRVEYQTNPKRREQCKQYYLRNKDNPVYKAKCREQSKKSYQKKKLSTQNI